MPPVLIENPSLNSPFEKPHRYFRFDESNITADIAAGRRASSYFLPIAAPKKKVKGLFGSLLADEKCEETDHVNRIRVLVHPRVLATKKPPTFETPPNNRFFANRLTSPWS